MHYISSDEVLRELESIVSLLDAQLLEDEKRLELVRKNAPDGWLDGFASGAVAAQRALSNRLAHTRLLLLSLNDSRAEHERLKREGNNGQYKGISTDSC